MRLKHWIRHNISLAAVTLAALLALLVPMTFAEEAAATAAPVSAADQQAELAKKLQNPVANLISVPIQSNWDWGIGNRDAMKYTVNVQPVIPFSISDDWNLITRTIVPFIYAEEPVAGAGNHGGMGDILQSFFFSPKAPVGGWILGGGPVFLYPSATDDALGGEKWGTGPTAVVLRQKQGWTYGMLANWVWSFAGNEDRAYVNNTFLQPFVSYTTKKFTTFGLNTESTYDWNNNQWTVPFNLTVQQLVKFGKQPVAFQFGPRLYVERPDGGPDWGLRFAVTLLFPK
jgi:hypothetical protein